MKTDDLDLLRAYVCDGNDDALARLVDRHGGWLLAVARRRLEDEHLAGDATQAVFMVLADKAPALVDSKRASLAAWLFHVMHLTCSRLRRTRVRQDRLESAAASLRQDRCLPQPDLLALMEDAIAQLPAADRASIVHRFYQSKPLAEVGQLLGISSEAAHKRISRALATVKVMMMRDGLDLIPDELLSAIEPADKFVISVPQDKQVNSIAKGTITMMTQMEAIDFAVMSAEFYVKDVEINLDFFEKLGFRRHFIDTPDAMGRVQRASLRGGSSARIWLRRASEAEGTRPMSGMTLFFWINGGADALAAHRSAIASQGIKVSAFCDDLTLRNFTVASPDGYTIGFFTFCK